MKSIPKLIRRFVGMLLLSSILLIALNVIVLVIIASIQVPNGHPWKTADEAAAALQNTKNGYVLSDEVSSELKSQNAWAIFIDNSTLQVVWQTDNLPDTVPMKYTISEIASLTRGYIDGYPTFTGEAKNGLMVLGYPKDRFWKHIWPSWDYRLIANFPKIALSTLAANITLLLFIYVIANSKLLKSVKPITNGIQALPTGEPVHIKESGLLSELAANINRTSGVLQDQKYQLRKRETARANWIAGVSHDIRTPLSIVMGYAGQLENDPKLTDSERQKALVILKQSERMRNLINDLNLASKLEYNMQPLTPKKENAVAIIRQVVVDFVNTDIEDKYSIKWETDDNLSACFINADKALLKRAISNLIQNSINHNEKGCTIYVSVRTEKNNCIICIEDSGVGASEEQIEKLNTTPHYMVCDSNTTEQRHGLGLLIVKQIVASHHGKVIIEQSHYGGFKVYLFLPLLSQMIDGNLIRTQMDNGN